MFYNLSLCVKIRRDNFRADKLNHSARTWGVIDYVKRKMMKETGNNGRSFEEDRSLEDNRSFEENRPY